MQKINTDTAKDLEIELRQGNDFDLTFVFTDSNLSDFDVSSYTAEFIVYNRKNENLTYFDSGVTATTNEINLSKTATQTASFVQGAYYYRLDMTDSGGVKKTWLNGSFVITNKKGDNVSSTSQTVTINTGSQNLSIEVLGNGGLTAAQKSKIDNSPTDTNAELSTLTTNVSTAQTTANTAVTNAATAQSTADNANDNAETRLSKASNLTDLGDLDTALTNIELINLKGKEIGNDSKDKIASGIVVANFNDKASMLAAAANSLADNKLVKTLDDDLYSVHPSGTFSTVDGVIVVNGTNYQFKKVLSLTKLLTFDTAEQAKTSLPNLPDTIAVRTLGRRTKNDGGHGEYVVDSSGDTDDGGSILAAASGSKRLKLQTKRPVVNIRQFGADGTISNDKDSISNAFAFIKAQGGGRININPGTYYVGGPNNFTNANNISFRGHGIGVSKLIRDTSAQWFGFEDCTNITIENCSFDSNGKTTFGGISFLRCSDILVQGNHFFDSNPNPSPTSDIYAIVTRQDGATTEGTPVQRIKVLNNIVEDQEIECGYVRDCLIQGNSIYRAPVTGGIAIGTNASGKTIRNVNINNNYIEDPYANGIWCGQDRLDESNVTFENVNISNNNIRFTSAGVGSGVGRPILIGSIKTGLTSHVIRSFVVNNNIIDISDCPHAINQAIYITNENDVDMDLEDMQVCNNVIYMNDASSAVSAISLKGVSRSVCNNNIIHNSGIGIGLDDSSENVTVLGNVIEASNTAIDVRGSFSLNGSRVIKDNIIKGNPTNRIRLQVESCMGDVIEDTFSMYATTTDLDGSETLYINGNSGELLPMTTYSQADFEILLTARQENAQFKSAVFKFLGTCVKGGSNFNTTLDFTKESIRQDGNRTTGANEWGKDINAVIVANTSDGTFQVNVTDANGRGESSFSIRWYATVKVKYSKT